MGQLAEVLAVSVEDVASGGPLLGASIDGPAAGHSVAAQAVEISGWALGAAAQPDEVEIVLGGAVRARAPLRHPRADIAEAFPGVTGAAASGFDVVLDATGAPADADFEVRARVGSNAVTIGNVRLRRHWRDDPAPGEAPLLSLVVVCEDRGEQLDRTIDSIRDQRYWPTEMLIVHRTPVADSSFAAWRELGVRSAAPRGFGPAALRNEGIRHTSGQLLAFVEAGSTLASGALGRCAELLARHPEAAGVIDGARDGAVAGAVYRRAAFEELEGFRDPRDRSCDGDLADRAATGYDVLFEAGVLVAARES